MPLGRPITRLALTALIALPFVAPTASAAATPPGTTVAEAATFHYAAPLAGPRALRLADYRGSLEATPSDDGTVDVRAVVREGDAARVRIVTRETAAGVAVCVLFRDEPPETCGVEAGSARSGHGADHDHPPRIDLVARVPRGISLRAATLTGDVRARGLTGDVDAATLNGDVTVAASGGVHAATLNGAVDVSFEAPPKSGHLELTSNNGPVKVTLPASSDADIDAQTLHGELTADFPLQIASTPGGFGPKSAHARLGRGGAQIELRALNGDVQVHTRR